MWEYWRGVSGWRLSGTVAVWGGSLWGVLQLRHLPVDASHSICGPWGCGPPVSALAAYHGFWIVLLALPTIVACRRLDPRALSKLGATLMLAGAAGLIGVAVWECVHWLPQVTDWQRKYLVQRYLFSVATWIDVPIVPIFLAGVACAITAMRRAGRSDAEFEATTVGAEESPAKATP